MDQLLALRVFARVVEAGNFTKAATSLRMPKATVSKLVQSLEAHVGVQLLARTTRQVVVTPDGVAYYQRTSRVVRELEDIDAGFAGTKGRLHGRLRVDIGSSGASLILLPALPTFLERYPNVRVDLGVSDHDVDLVGDNVDCVIRGGPLADTSLVSRKIGAARWVTCATPAYLEQYGSPRRPRDLEKHRVVGYVSTRTGRVVPLRFVDGGRAVSIEPTPVVGVNESNAHFAAGLAGIGIVQVFSYLAKSALARGDLVEVLPRHQPEPYPFYVVYPPNRPVSARLRAFLDWARDLFVALE